MDLRAVRAVSVHLAASLSSRPRAGFHLTWSRYGVERVAGGQGCTYSTMCMHETVRYLGSLGVDDKLAAVVAQPEGRAPQILSLQLYCDGPNTLQVHTVG